jgi:glucosyl-dolichyl phosphate glucuronosyltransferase
MSLVGESRMDVTIAICTWNQAGLLDRALRRLAELRVPEGLRWEVLVVDNNCTDDTPVVVARHADRLPVSRLVERAQGLSNARNCALKHAAGDLLIYIDDDVLVDDGWLDAYSVAMARWPKAAYFGGIIVPKYEGELPKWFRGHRVLASNVGEAHDLGPHERELNRGEFPWGGNMAFRRTAVRGFTFRPELGRRGSERAACEDEAFCQELADAGLTGVWLPGAAIQHVIGPQRLTLSFVRKNFIGRGVTDVRMSGWDTEGVPLVLGVPRWMLLPAVKAHAKYLWRRAVGNPAWIDSYIEAARSWGALTEYRRRARERRVDPSA